MHSLNLVYLINFEFFDYVQEVLFQLVEAEEENTVRILRIDLLLKGGEEKGLLSLLSLLSPLSLIVFLAGKLRFRNSF